MYKIIFRKKSREIIEFFITSYKNSYLKMYSDTGIYYEDIIRKNYIENSKKFYYEIKFNIEENLQEEKIIVYRPLKNKNLQITIRVGSFNLFVEYSENKTEKIRYVEDIEFFKK